MCIIISELNNKLHKITIHLKNMYQITICKSRRFVRLRIEKRDRTNDRRYAATTSKSVFCELSGVLVVSRVIHIIYFYHTFLSLFISN